MTAAWTAPKTWNTNDLVTATDLNTHLRDNLDWLKAPPTANYVANQASDYTTTSTSFVNVDGTNLSLTITTTGGNVLIGFSGAVSNTPAATVSWLDPAWTHSDTSRTTAQWVKRFWQFSFR